MISIGLTAEDLSQMRLAISPIWEAVLSIRVLQDPQRHSLYLGWVREAQPQVTRMLPALSALVPRQGYFPDFLTPPPTTDQGSIGEALTQAAATPPEVIRAQVKILLGDYPETEAALSPFLHNPSAALADYLALMADYWDQVMATHWQYLFPILEADVLHMARTLATQGPAALFEGMHPQLRFSDSRLEVEKAVDYELHPAGQGLRLIPTVFSWPHIYVLTEGPIITIGYPARGIGRWDQRSEGAQQILAKAVGNARARVLHALDHPQSVSDLADRLYVTAGALSQQLSRLKAAGLVVAFSEGKRRFYKRSVRGEALMHIFDDSVLGDVRREM